MASLKRNKCLFLLLEPTLTWTHSSSSSSPLSPVRPRTNGLCSAFTQLEASSLKARGSEMVHTSHVSTDRNSCLDGCWEQRLTTSACRPKRLFLFLCKATLRVQKMLHNNGLLLLSDFHPYCVLVVLADKIFKFSVNMFESFLFLNNFKTFKNCDPFLQRIIINTKITTGHSLNLFQVNSFSKCQRALQ